MKRRYLLNAFLILLTLVFWGRGFEVIKSDFNITEESDELASCLTPDVVVDRSEGNNGYVVVWRRTRDFPDPSDPSKVDKDALAPLSDIYLQRYDLEGDRIGERVRVTTEENAGNYFHIEEEQYPTVQIYQNRILVIYSGSAPPVSWGVTDYEILCQRYQFTGTQITPIERTFHLNQEKETNIVFTQVYPRAFFLNRDRYVVVWVDSDVPPPSPGPPRGSFNIRKYEVNFNGTSASTGEKVNQDSGDGYQNNPEIGGDREGRYVVVWHDGRGESYHIYGRQYPSGEEFRVTTEEFEECLTPRISVSWESGNFVVVWSGVREGEKGIWARLYSPPVQPLTGMFKVSENSTFPQLWPVVEMNESGKFVVVWEDYSVNRGVLVGQLFNERGEKIGSLFNLTQPTSTPQVKVRVAMRNNRAFFVWINYQERRRGDIFGKIIHFTELN